MIVISGAIRQLNFFESLHTQQFYHYLQRTFMIVMVSRATSKEAGTETSLRFCNMNRKNTCLLYLRP